MTVCLKTEHRITIYSTADIFLKMYSLSTVFGQIKVTTIQTYSAELHSLSNCTTVPYGFSIYSEGRLESSEENSLIFNGELNLVSYIL